MIRPRRIVIAVAILLALVLWFCGPPSQEKERGSPRDTLVYLNHSDTARYVGMATCRLCHQDIYNTFVRTGMGRSFDVATRSKSSADFATALVRDEEADFDYRAFWNRDSLFICEYRMEGRDTVHARTEQVNFIIGSGQHTNSHLQAVNGYVNQMPMTYYTQKKKWDLPPGFENGFNTRFSRKIGLECMSCHNAYPDMVAGSENKYSRLPRGIDCERCHGPGSIHVAQRQSGSRVDTSRFVDYSIVNPAKLSIDAQFDICQRCHLQGNAVLKEGKSFLDFRPGQKLSDFISVFLPKYANSDDEFIMASHADRLKQSPCFIRSYERVKGKKGLKPYKDALTCVTCHNPHLSVRETNSNVFNEACTSCHDKMQPGGDRAAAAKRIADLRKSGCGLHAKKASNCVSCHMPVSGSVDIPHVTVHDHYIRKPVSRQDKEKLKSFLGLFDINEKDPDVLTRAKAYINQYDKFEANPCFLDSAAVLLSDKRALKANLAARIQLAFIRRDFKTLLGDVGEVGEAYCYNERFTKKSYDNADAWAAYRIAEAFNGTGTTAAALKWFERAVNLAPYHLDFRNKYASALAAAGRTRDAESQYSFILSEHKGYVSAYTNLGFIRMTEGRYQEASQLYTTAERLDPDNEPLLLNFAGYYLSRGQNMTAKRYLERVMRVNPANLKAKTILDQMKRK